MRIFDFNNRGASASRSMRVMWLIPSLDGNNWTEFTLSYGYCTGFMAVHNIECEPYLHIGDCFIEIARNKAVAKFMSNPLNTHLVMGDVDQAWHLQPFVDMLFSEHEFTAMCPPLKAGFKEIYTSKTDGEITGNFMETDRVGTGFVIFKRSVFTKMINAYPELIQPDYAFNGKNGYSLFELKSQGEVVGEDLTFCDRWRKIGGKIHVHIDAPMRHRGTNVWEGNIKNQIKKENEKIDMNKFQIEYQKIFDKATGLKIKEKV